MVELCLCTVLGGNEATGVTRAIGCTVGAVVLGRE